MKWSALVSGCTCSADIAMTLTLGVSGAVGLSTSTNYLYGIRL